MRTQPHSEHRRGFTLLEILLVMGTLGMVVLLGMATVAGAFKLEKAAAASQRRQIVRNVLADQFRADVAGAASAPEWLLAVAPGAAVAPEKVAAGPAFLILRRAEGCLVLYQWNGAQLNRYEIGGAVPQPRLTLASDCLGVEFVRTGPERRIITLRLSERQGEGNGKRQLEIAAALGGDLR